MKVQDLIVIFLFTYFTLVIAQRQALPDHGSKAPHVLQQYPRIPTPLGLGSMSKVETSAAALCPSF